MEWKLKDLTVDGKGSYGIGAPAVPYQEDKLTYLRITDINDDGSLNFSDLKSVDAEDAEKYILKENDIVFARTGNSTGRSYFYEKQHGTFVYAGFLIKFSLDPHKVNPRILKYYTHSKPYFDWVNSFDTGGTRGNINAKTYGDMEIELPSRKVQDNIVSILSSLDRKIELNNNINADLEEMAQTIFKNWFVDFEPFKDGKFVESELGMIPEGWKVISLNEILDNVSGYSYKGSELQSSNIAMATIKNFERKGGFKTEGYKEIVISKKIKETQFVDMFDVLVAHTDLTQNAEIVGNPAIVLSKGGYEKLIMSMDLTKVISKIDGITNGLLYCILSTSRFKEHALGYVNGTTVLHMSKKAVPEYTCAFPKDINQIRDLCITLDSIYKRMAVTYEEFSRLSALRDILLPKLMSGELEISE